MRNPARMSDGSGKGWVLLLRSNGPNVLLRPCLFPPVRHPSSWAGNKTDERIYPRAPEKAVHFVLCSEGEPMNVQPQSKKRRLLLVDDHAVVREGLRSLLGTDN